MKNLILFFVAMHLLLACKATKTIMQEKRFRREEPGAHHRK
jgi:hypothetical protein